ncbi:MAG TPA: S41 family peptidase [Pyrinomonadaceae bacterium]|nr:S41 family peptidase [Pyrinomonadaceae bacterium]
MKNSHFRLAAFLWFTAFFFIYPVRVSCQSVQGDKKPVVDAHLRKRLVEQIIRELKAKYVAPEKVKEIESQLRKRLQSGVYDKIDNAREMASSLTDDLRAAGKDLHLFVAYDPDLERALLATPSTPSVDLKELPPTAERLAGLRNSNYNFRKVEIMRGNVGYLELRSFVDLTYSKETAVASMSFLANTDAIIIDLRKNPGGFINLEIFLASYFYAAEPVEWLSRYHHDTNVTVKDWTLREVPGKRVPDVDLYILTSGETGSAAEGFSFMLQQRKRATIIGEKTSGAGYGNKEMPIGDGFVFFLSIFRQFDPRTGRGWQEVGVEPDIVVKAERALSVAHTEAVKNLSAKSTDAHRRQQLSWLATLLELEAYGPKQISSSLLESYAGKYDQGKIEISLEQGQLYFLGASGVRRPLQALSDDSFLIVDASVPPENQARVRFVKNAEGIVTELRLMVADGRTFPRAKVQESKESGAIRKLIDDFVSADWQRIHPAESALESLQAESLPALVKLLDRDERVELHNTWI